MMPTKIINKLLENTDYAVRLKTYVQLLDFEYNTKEVQHLLANIEKNSQIVSSLLPYLEKHYLKENHVYNKWQGAHWNLALLADIKYIPDKSKVALAVEKELEWLLSDDHWERKPIINGLRRFCASQEGNGIYSLLSLGFHNEQVDHLVQRLIDYQWPDGGWNCDKNPKAHKSSYHESLIPLRALIQYRKKTNNVSVEKSINNACELFLKRKLFRKSSDSSIIDPNWLLLSYPPYWHYDILMTLKVLSEGDKIDDPRTSEALDVLESKKLEDDGFPAEKRYYQASNGSKRSYSPVDWGGVNKKKMNPWVTIDALYVLKKAKRIDIEY